MIRAALVDRAPSRYGVFRLAAAILLFALLFWIVDPHELWATLARADALLVAAVCLLAIIWLLLGALNVWILLRRRDAIPLRTFTQVYMMSWSMGLLIPGQLGDATQILLLRRHGLGAASSTAAYAVDKAISLGIFGLIGAYGLARYAVAASPGQALAVSSAVVALSAGAVGAAVKLASRSRPPERVRAFLHSISTEIAYLTERKELLALNVFISIAKWLLAACMYWVAFVALDAAVTFEAAATIPALSTLIAYIPITIAGLGTTEWTAVVLFHRTGLAPVDVVGVYLIMRGILIVCAAAILGAGEISRHAHPH
jgi:uncharacterized membrane protein YbhN (UPF0104 family)